MAAATASLSLTLPVFGRNVGAAKLAHGPSLTAPHKPRSAKLSSNGRTRIVANALPPSSERQNKGISVAGLTALALTAATAVPEIAEAAGPGVSPSLKNFLLSIVAGGLVAAVLTIAVIGVANFDPVKRT